VLYLVDLRLLQTIVLKTKSHLGLSVRKRLLINKSYETKPYCWCTFFLCHCTGK
jgi:hypothetical protein